MRSRRVAVLGAGMAGLAASLVLARDGHDVLLIERDPVADSAPEAAFAWERRGISHFQQPHAFIPRGRRDLREHLGDVYALLLGAGASDVDCSRKLPGALEPADAELQFVAVRRPLIEWGLRRAVLAQRGIELRSGIEVRGVTLEDGRVRGVRLDSGPEAADLVVDAMGRRSPVRAWLEQAGHVLPNSQRSDCGVIYYSRYFRVRPGCQLPDGPWPVGPRGDLGHLGFTSFPGDNGTFSALLAVPTGVPELKLLMHERAFQAAIERIPLLMQWADPGLSEPITPVQPMGGLQNTLHDPGERFPSGLFPVSDALCHTDPVLAHGLSFALIHALELARVLRAHADAHDAFAAYRAAVLPALRERYELATALDEQRLRMWTGAPMDMGDRRAHYALFSFFAAGAVASVDPGVFRVFMRRIGLLDSTRVLDDDEPLQQRIEQRFRELSAQPRPPAGPARDEMRAVIRAAVQS